MDSRSSRHGESRVTQLREPSRSRSGSSSVSRHDFARPSHTPSRLSAVHENEAMNPVGHDDLRTQTRSSRHPTQSTRHQDSRASHGGDYARDSQRTVRPSDNEGWSRAVLPAEYAQGTSTGNSRALALREKTVTRSSSTRTGMTTIPAGVDPSHALALREKTVTRSQSTRSGMTTNPAGYEPSRGMVTREGTVARSQSTRADMAMVPAAYEPPRGAGFETRLERLESKQGTVSRSQSTRASSSSGPGFETRLQQLEKPKQTENTKSENTKALEKKLESMQAQMNQMKLDSHKKELQAKDDKIREVQKELDAERAKDKSAPIYAPVYVRRHGLYCTCYLCY
ncbi:hypothetical protein G7Y79_00049g085280 [Physcia stellaris]|nr:hypothetical protein G7Y79_00049g085280 [Physcia stellaris]